MVRDYRHYILQINLFLVMESQNIRAKGSSDLPSQSGGREVIQGWARPLSVFLA